MISARPSGAKLLVAVAAAAVITIAVASALTPAPASAENDIVGTWTFTFEYSSSTVVCPDMEITRIGLNVTLRSDECYGDNQLDASFDKATGEFLAAGCITFDVVVDCIVLEGDATPGGNTITGVHGSLIDIRGKFNATRNPTFPTRTVIPPGVGGVAFDPDLGALAVEAHEPSRYSTAVIVAITAAAAAFVALGGAAFYARRGAG